MHVVVASGEKSRNFGRSFVLLCLVSSVEGGMTLPHFFSNNCFEFSISSRDLPSIDCCAQKPYFSQCSSQRESVYKQSATKVPYTQYSCLEATELCKFKKTQHSLCFWAQQNSVAMGKTNRKTVSPQSFVLLIQGFCF